MKTESPWTSSCQTGPQWRGFATEPSEDAPIDTDTWQFARKCTRARIATGAISWRWPVAGSTCALRLLALLRKLQTCMPH